MNESIHSTGWSGAQAQCPNCGPQGQTGFAPGQQGVSNGMPPPPMFPSPQSTSNYADLGMAPTGMTQQEALLPPVMQSTQQSPQALPPMMQSSQMAPRSNLSQLQTLVGENPSATELPGLTAVDLGNRPTAYNAQSLQYLNGFLVTQIGRSVTITSLVGSNSMDVRSGRLVGVGANYILLNEFETNDIVACDFYSIKFVKVYY